VSTVLCLLATLVLAVDVQLLPSVLTRLGGTQVQLGLLLSSLFFLYPAASAFSGWLADRLGKRPVLAGGAILVAVSFGAAAPFASPWARIAAVVLFGAGSGILEGVTSALLADLHPGKERVILNLAQLFYCIGATGGPAIISLALTEIPSLGAGTLLAIAAGVGGLLFLGFLMPSGGRAHGRASAPISFRALTGDPQWKLLAVCLFLYVASEMGIAGWAAQYGNTVLGLSEAAAPLCLTIFWAGGGFARLLAIFFPSMVPARPLLLVSVSVTLIGQVLAFTLSGPAALVFLGVAGVGMGAVWPTIVSIAGARFKDSSGMGVGVLIAAGALAVPIIQPLIGLLSQPHLLGLRFTLLALSTATLANLFLVSRIKEPRRAGPDPAAPGRSELAATGSGSS
jgi:fucose permease